MNKPLHILVVDDEANNRKLLETLLLAEKHQVHCVASGDAALQSLGERKPDLVLLDLMMPGLDGFEVLQRIRANPLTRSLAVIMVTALDDAASQARLTAAGINEILLKPIDRWALNAAIARVAQDLAGGAP